MVNIEKISTTTNRFVKECYQNIFSVAPVRDTPYLYFIFGLYFKVFTNITKYTYIVFTNKRQSIASHTGGGGGGSLNVCHTKLNSGQAALRKLAYGEAAGQTVVSVNEWAASEACHSLRP